MSNHYQPERPDERVLFEQRRHWITLAPLLFSLGGLIAIVTAAEYLMGRYADQVTKILPLTIVQLVVVILLALCLLMALVGWWVYAQNRLILTNYHVVQITQSGLLNRSVSQLSLSRVQDVETRQNGLLANLLGFGDLTVETAGEEENFVFRQVAGPYKLCDRIMRAHDELGGEVPPAATGGV